MTITAAVVIYLCKPGTPVKGTVFERHSRALYVLLILLFGSLIAEMVFSYLAGRFELTLFTRARDACSFVQLSSALGLAMLSWRSEKEREEEIVEGITKPRTIEHKYDFSDNKGNVAIGDNATQTAYVTLTQHLYGLIDAVKTSPESVLTADEKQAALSDLQTIADQSGRPKEYREPFKIMPALERLTKIFSAAGVFVETLEKIAHALNLHLR